MSLVFPLLLLSQKKRRTTTPGLYLAAVLVVLGFTNLSLAKADAQLAQTSWRMLAYTLFALVDISLLTWLFVWRLVGQPLKHLKDGTKQLADGNLGYQLRVDSTDEVGELATSFNRMSLQLRAANEEIVAWAKTLEDRVEQKTR